MTHPPLGKSGMLTALSVRAEKRDGQVILHCRCACGAEKDVPQKNFVDHRSCGCANGRRRRKGGIKSAAGQRYMRCLELRGNWRILDLPRRDTAATEGEL